jgi:hypothetical protein
MSSLLITEDIYYAAPEPINSGDILFSSQSKIHALKSGFLFEASNDQHIDQNYKNELVNEQRADNTYGHADLANTSVLEQDVDTNLDDYVTKPVRDFLELTANKIDKKIRNLLANKATTFEKQLESYGVVDAINLVKGKRIVSARIYDQDTDEILDNIDFEAKEFTPSDQKLLVENAVFYWRVGLDRNLIGGHRNVSEFRIRRRITRKKRPDETNATADAIVDYFKTVFKEN